MGRAGASSRSTTTCWPTRWRHPAVVTVEDGYCQGGAGALDRPAPVGAGRRPRPPVATMGVPVRFIPHGKPDAILARLGLDARGVAAQVRAALAPAPVSAL